MPNHTLRLESTSPCTTTGSSPSTSSGRSTHGATPGCSRSLLALLCARCVVNQQCVEWQRIREDVVSDIVSTNCNTVEMCCWCSGDVVSQCELDALEVGVHLWVDG